MYPATYSTERLVLRELAEDDVDALHAIYGDPEVTTHLSFGEPRDRDQVAEILRRSIASATTDPRSEYALGIALSETGQLIGFARLATDPHQHLGATIGFALRQDQWGQGLGTESVQALMGLAFDKLGLHRLWAARAPLNTASHRTLIAAGMQEEGRIREHVRVRGVWRDSIVYGVLEREWNAE
ncbi:GNAT family protein [Actinomadura sp. DC4]|uniref:GNAT family N-acetyltransferase n=1 Tax=Actinomadura sp. DC4 TaxID=3055069 RepID=UPI0025AF60E1|nr:GNAT family protein [Actinomadura sp. DC4]MDN3360132.1 GNAT family protein [Actinomadura sp. DC4]